MAIEKFKLPRSSYEEICKIIIAYGNFREATSLDEVAKVSKVPRTSVSANNAFLTAVRIVEKGQKKMRTDVGGKLANALQYDLADKIKKSWVEVIKNNDFLSKMVLAVQVRKGMGVSDLESHIAYSAGEAKAKYVMTGARTVVDIFKASGLVEEKNDRIIPKEKVGVDVTRHDEEEPPEDSGKPDVSGLGPRHVSLQIQVRIDAKPSELDGLAKKLKGFVDSLKEGGESQREEN